MQLIGPILIGALLMIMVLAVVWIVCTIIVMVKMFQNDMAPLAVVGLFVPLILYVFGWIKAREWGLVRTMVVWTFALVLAPVLAFGTFAAVLASGALEGSFQAVQVATSSMPGGVYDLTQYRGQVGKVLYFDVTGTPYGTVYGSDVYTDDSALPTAVVHAGVLKPGETATVKVTILGGQPSYPSVTRNGVTSTSWGAWGGSYKVELGDGGKPIEAAPVVGEVAPGPVNLVAFRGQNGLVKTFQVTGSTVNAVWGTDVYTDDSSLASAAVHAGVLKAGETGSVKVTILPGQRGYRGSARNGVVSQNYNAWGGSYRVQRAD